MSENDYNELNEQESGHPGDQTQEHSSEPPTGTSDPTQFRFDDNAGSILRGKTAAETVDIVNALGQASQAMYTQLQAQQAQLQALQTTQHSNQQGQVPDYDEDLWVTQPAQAEARLQDRILNQVQSSAVPILDNQAQMARALVARDNDYKSDFDRWGHEIDQLVNSMPVQARTAEAYMKAVQLVRSNHVDELVEEQISQRLSRTRNADVARSSNAYPYEYEQDSNDDVWKTFEKSALGRDMLKTQGKAAIARAAEAQGRSLKEFAELVSKNRSQPDPSSPGVWRNTNMTNA